jgi:hypothetical protein
LYFIELADYAAFWIFGSAVSLPAPDFFIGGGGDLMPTTVQQRSQPPAWTIVDFIHTDWWWKNRGERLSLTTRGLTSPSWRHFTAQHLPLFATHNFNCERTWRFSYQWWDLVEYQCIKNSCEVTGLQILPDWQEFFGHPSGKMLGKSRNSLMLLNTNIFRQAWLALHRPLVLLLLVLVVWIAKMQSWLIYASQGLPLTPLASDELGRRAALFIGSMIMLSGVAVQFAADSVKMFIAARLLSKSWFGSQTSTDI